MELSTKLFYYHYLVNIIKNRYFFLNIVTMAIFQIKYRFFFKDFLKY